MAVLRFKPVVSTGFSVFLTGVVLLGGATVSAQDYIDVEAEREAARRAAGDSVPIYTSNGAGTGLGSSVEPTTATTATTAASAPAEDYSVQGIRPYSGQTISAQPVETRGVATGTADVGSLVVQLQQLQEEVRRLNGLVEEQSAQIQRLKEQSLERYVDVDRRLAELGTSTPGSVTSPAGQDTSVTSTPPTTDGLTFGGPAVVNNTPAQPGEEAAYQTAYDYVKARNFPQAVEAFKGFLGDYPFGRFAPNAHYWLGELYLVIDPPDPELARQSFKLLLDQYPDNSKVPDALYKLGKVHFLKGNRDRSREYLNRVMSDYKGHPAAQLAQDFIKENF